MKQLQDMNEKYNSLMAALEALTQALGDTKVPGAIPVEVANVGLHRQWQPPKFARIEQAAAGFSVFATPEGGLHYIKVLGAFLTVDATGTLQFFAGSGIDSGASKADYSISGTMDIATNGGFVLPMTDPDNAWLWGQPGETLSINTATSKASGFIVYCNSADNG